VADAAGADLSAGAAFGGLDRVGTGEIADGGHAAGDGGHAPLGFAVGLRLSPFIAARAAAAHFTCIAGDVLHQDLARDRDSRSVLLGYLAAGGGIGDHLDRADRLERDSVQEDGVITRTAKGPRP